ncbi:type II toxin-antitoxin system VapC family toxin [Paenibacillus soyae]|uniref:Type II toxin-antitoxin system VapC family toxin n=1 Tax=Paenibacillus soyae TaxID=2969249 RepID=A0A9X2MTC4_9BACL|nr:type II toxin-antitoxin system VapC family toxin [Paenibacillus soyae]MCR2806621.1 type II toxin-antitoxin system VapC family toxin [Paenibacillus soyae]
MNRLAVLDASAVLALLFRERGSELVAQYVESFETCLSAVNFSEVVAKQRELHIPEESTMEYLGLLGIEIVAFDSEAAIQTAALREVTKFRGLSLGDRACLALGKMRNCPVLTADKAWSGTNLGVEIIVIR